MRIKHFALFIASVCAFVTFVRYFLLNHATYYGVVFHNGSDRSISVQFIDPPDFIGASQLGVVEAKSQRIIAVTTGPEDTTIEVRDSKTNQPLAHYRLKDARFDGETFFIKYPK